VSDIGMTTERITIDGSQGEGGGQILRTALALSLATGRPIRIENIRAGREKPGLLRQHLTAVHAAVAVSGGQAAGAELGSRAVDFQPGDVRGGEYHFAVGTAGSATLVLQAVLPALLTATKPSMLTLEGGTHNPMAPPFDFLARTLLPLLHRMGANVDARLEHHGFYPAGGGRFTLAIEPCGRLMPLVLVDRGDVTTHARGLVALLPDRIAKKELGLVRHRLGLERTQAVVESIESSAGPGNVLMIELRSSAVTEVVTAFGIKGVHAEEVARQAAEEASEYLAAGVPVGRYLADQLLVPLALAGGGVFRTLSPSQHTMTNVDVIRQFLDVPIRITKDESGAYRVQVGTVQP